MHPLNNKDIVPSKTFLFGEYALLFGSPAYVIAHNPCFLIGEEAKSSKVHKDSLAGKLLKEFNKDLDLNLEDPHNKKGGFGRSTAEFISACRQISEFKEKSTQDIFQKYMSYYKHEAIKPSGADLVAQLEKSSLLFSKDSDVFSKTHIEWSFSGFSLILCHTNNKVETHNHLKKDLAKLDFEKLKSIAADAAVGLMESNFTVFLKSLKDFSKEQLNLGLLHENTIRVTSALNSLETVVFSRGCGALGADVVAIIVNESVLTQDLSSDFKKLNLDVICRID